MLPSGFYSVFFPLNKTESPCQLGRGLRTRASQCVRLAGGQWRIKCPLPLEESGPHRSGGGWGARVAGAGGSCVCNTSATGRGVSTNSAVCWEQSCVEGRPWARAISCHTRCVESLAWGSETTFLGAGHPTLSSQRSL